MPPPAPARPFRDANQDAFFVDLEDAANKNSATLCPLDRLASLQAQLSLSNPLDADVPAADTGRPATLTRAETIPKANRKENASYTIFVPQKVRDTPPDLAKVTLLYCVGQEMIRHGLSIFFEKSADRVLITIPGREDGWIKPPAAWGIGITTKQIDDLFTAAGRSGQKWQVEIMAGYSTGYRGVNGTINNGLISISNLKTLIMYDALYRGDEPAPGGNTALALKALPTSTTIVTYDVTEGGTPHPFRVTVPTATVIDLKSKFNSLAALISARNLEKGVRDGYVKAADVPTAVQTLISAGLPARGTMASSSLRSGVATLTLDDWATTNKTAIAGFKVNDAWAIIRDKQLMGWAVAGPGDMAHDGFIPEFGWEFLPRDP